MYAPHTVTVYNQEIVYGADFAETIVNHITVLRGVFLDESKAVNVRESGLEGADAATLYIPFGISTPGKTYLPPMVYWASQDKDAHWTLSTQGKGGTTFFVSGEVVEDITFDRMNMTHDGVYLITKVDAKNFGSPAVQHWEVGGK